MMALNFSGSEQVPSNYITPSGGDSLNPLGNQGSINCGILPSRMGEHGMGLETIENMKNMEDMEMMEDNVFKHSICQRDDSKHPLVYEFYGIYGVDVP